MANELTQQKFLDQGGVTILWSRILSKLGDESKGLQDKIKQNTDAIAILNGEASQTGSVAYTVAAEIAKVVADADESFDTLKEIADWIKGDPTGAAGMANDITALENKLVGVDKTVVETIADAITAALTSGEVDKYALATDLTALATRVKTLEDANYQNADQVSDAIDDKIDTFAGHLTQNFINPMEEEIDSIIAAMPDALEEADIDAAIANATPEVSE